MLRIIPGTPFKCNPYVALYLGGVTKGKVRSTRSPRGARKADCVCLKRPAPAPAPCPRANPGLHLATHQASGRVAPAPRRCAATRASAVWESMVSSVTMKEGRTRPPPFAEALNLRCSLNYLRALRGTTGPAD